MHIQLILLITHFLVVSSLRTGATLQSGIMDIGKRSGEVQRASIYDPHLKGRRRSKLVSSLRKFKHKLLVNDQDVVDTGAEERGAEGEREMEDDEDEILEEEMQEEKDDVDDVEDVNDVDDVENVEDIEDIDDDDDVDNEEAVDEDDEPEFVPKLYRINPLKRTKTTKKDKAKIVVDRPWISEFLSFKASNEGLPMPEMIEENGLQSKIRDCENPVFCSDNLKQWTRNIVEQNKKPSSKFNDHNYKKYGLKKSVEIDDTGVTGQKSTQSQDQVQASPLAQVQALAQAQTQAHAQADTKVQTQAQTQAQIDEQSQTQDQVQVQAMANPTPRFDVEEFINYLVEYENFKKSDLQFLRTIDLDHGLSDIERELNKIKQRESTPPKTIVIGGEDTNEPLQNIGSILKPYILYLTLLIFVI